MKGDRSFFKDESLKSNREAALEHMVRCADLREICEAMAELAGDVTDPKINDGIPKDLTEQARKIGGLAQTAMALLIETAVRHRTIGESEIAKRLEEAAGPAVVDLTGKE